MKKLIAIVLIINAILLAGRFWQEMQTIPVAAGGRIDPNPNPNGDVNCDGNLNIADASKILSFLFLGGPAPWRGEQTSTCGFEISRTILHSSWIFQA